MTSDNINKSPSSANRQARFLTGSTMRHVIVMSLSSAIGLMMIFMVDLVDLLFLSMLNIQEVQSAVGIAGTILFATISLSVGLMIGLVALTSKAIGKGDEEKSRQMASVGSLYLVLFLTIVSIFTTIFAQDLLIALGAEGVTLTYAYDYFIIIAPSLPLMGILMATTGCLRALGDARRSAFATIIAALVNGVLDPILILTLDMGIEGAAIASVAARIASALYGIYAVVIVHRLWTIPKWENITAFLRPYAVITIPAILTNLATPFSNGYVQLELAQYGDAALASWSFISRLVPVAFGTLFALSGAIGPIIGQNYGAGQFERIKHSYRDGLIFTVIYTILVSLLLILMRSWLMDRFHLVGEAREMANIFILICCPLFLFNGMLFVANASFNTLGHAVNATFFNWGRASLGTIPVVMLGGLYGGSVGVLVGHALGAVPFGIGGAYMAWRLISHLHLKPNSD